VDGILDLLEQINADGGGVADAESGDLDGILDLLEQINADGGGVADADSGDVEGAEGARVAGNGKAPQLVHCSAGVGW
jgi:DNA-binding ferritin-like protein (Dps family)